MENNLEPLRGQLHKLRERLGSRILLSQLGIALREVDPAFTPGAYGALTLGELLRRLPELGRTVGEGAQKTWIFEGAESGVRGPARLQTDIWKSVTDYRSDTGTWHMDLETFALRHSSRDADNLLQTSGERFVALPKLGVDFQKNLARDFVCSRLPEQIEAAERALSSEDWNTALAQLLEAAELVGPWKVHRASSITEEVTKWGEQHGIPRDRILETPGSTQRKGMPHPANQADSLTDMRNLIHDAVEMMSLPELAALQVPPAYLALAASRRRR